MPTGHAICIPGLGIILSDQSGKKHQDLSLLRHEYGHVLQYRLLGFWKFYLFVGFPSLFSAMRSRWSRHQHHLHRVEIDANNKSYVYFNKPADWPTHRFPLT
jgi:hypothetical protein